MKAVAALLLASSIIVFGFVVQAHANTIQITSNAYPVRSPQVKGDYLVWQGYVDGDWEIFVYNAADGQTIRITDNDHDDISPQTDGRYVVWQGFHEGEWDVFVWNGNETLRISGGSAEDVSPQIANGFAVWTSVPFGADFIGPGRIVLYDADNAALTALSERVDPGNSLDDRCPRINGETVVWRQADANGNTTSYVYELRNGTVREVPPGLVWNESPQRDGNLTVLTRHDGGGRELFVLDTSSKTYHQITDNSGTEERYPSISGCYIAWMAQGEIFLARQVILTTAATHVQQRSFLAAWNPPAVSVDSYILDVWTGKDSIQYVKGFEAKAVPGACTSAKVTGLSPETTYYYRVVPVIDGAISGDSNVPAVATLVRKNPFPALAVLLVLDGQDQTPIPDRR